MVKGASSKVGTRQICLVVIYGKFPLKSLLDSLIGKTLGFNQEGYKNGFDTTPDTESTTIFFDIDIKVNLIKRRDEISS